MTEIQLDYGTTNNQNSLKWKRESPTEKSIKELLMVFIF